MLAAASSGLSTSLVMMNSSLRLRFGMAAPMVRSLSPLP